MALISSALTTSIIIIAVSGAPLLFKRWSKKAEAKRKENGEKYIDYSNVIIGFIYGIGALFVGVGVFVYFFSDEPWAGIGFIAMGLILLIPALICQALDTTINWSPDYICGAKSSMCLKKNTLLWADIVFVKLHPTQMIQLQDKSGKSIYWSVYHSGWYRVIEELRRIRPDIDTSDFD